MNEAIVSIGMLVDRVAGSSEIVTQWGERSRIRISAEQTGGSLAVLDYRAPKDFGPPRHLHRKDDEILIIRSGSIAIWTPDAGRTASVGDVVMLPKGVPHTWRAFGDEALQVQVIVTPGEFETFFDRIVARDLTLANMAELTEVASQAGMELVGPPLSDAEVAAIVRAEATGSGKP